MKPEDPMILTKAPSLSPSLPKTRSISKGITSAPRCPPPPGLCLSIAQPPHLLQKIKQNKKRDPILQLPTRRRRLPGSPAASSLSKFISANLATLASTAPLLHSDRPVVSGLKTWLDAVSQMDQPCPFVSSAWDLHEMIPHISTSPCCCSFPSLLLAPSSGCNRYDLR